MPFNITTELVDRLTANDINTRKPELLSFIDTRNTDLSTDNEFAQAQADVKTLNAIEKFLKESREYAVTQSVDIFQFIESVDEIIERSRDIRLVINRCVKQQKEKIKKISIDKGIDKIKEFIEEQSPDFKLIDHSCFLDRKRFNEAAMFHTTRRALENAIDRLCKEIRDEILEKAASVAENASLIDEEDPVTQTLLEDRENLLAFEKLKLEWEIDKRKLKHQKAITEKKSHRDDTSSTHDYTSSMEQIEEETLFHIRRVGNKLQVVSSDGEVIEVTKPIIESLEEIMVLIDDQFQPEINPLSIELFEKLRERRKLIARRERIPTYCIFGNKTLEEMAVMRPESSEQMLSISGIGVRKLEKYGDDFLSVITQFEEES